MSKEGTEMEVNELPKYAQKALGRLRAGVLLCRTSAQTEEAMTKGGGYLYTLEPGGKKFPSASAKLLIDHGLVRPREDGLLPGASQTFEVHAN